MEDRKKRAMVMACTLCALMCATWGPGAGAAQPTLSTADRLRMLYAPQLSFTAAGDPLIRLGLLEDVRSAKFTPNEPIRVLPNGEGGPEVELPGGKTYTVSISKAKPGEYTYWVVIDRLPVDQRGRAGDVKNRWLQRGHIPERFEVGGLFAVRGQVFDSRTILFAVGGTKSRKKARELQTKMRAKYGIEGGLHSQLVTHPEGLITLEGAGVDATVRHRDILQISPLSGREDEIRYTIPGIKKNYKEGTMTRTYTGSLIFTPDRGGDLVVINSLGAEKVLKGVVPAEIYASSPQPALQAQAIAARNEIFSAVGVRNLADPYMLRADVMDQVYGGVGVEDPRTSKAVDATRGQVMFFGKQIIEAFYSSNAGGFTENNENVWAMEPRAYLRGRPDADMSKVPVAFRDGIDEDELDAFLTDGFDAHSKGAPVSSSKLFRWTREVTPDKPSKWLRDAGYKVGKLKNVEVLSRGVSGRVVQLKVTGSKGSAVIERELNVRRLFGGLRSGLFLVDIEKNSRGYITNLKFRGAGFGHGVGMCQTGAVGMAADGKTAAQILNHYYKGVEVKGLY